MRLTTKQIVSYYVENLHLYGNVLEVGGHSLAKCAINEFSPPRFYYNDLNIAPSDIPNTIISDITNCRNEISDDSFDVVFTSDVFEHIDRPWLAASEIVRILKPEGVAFVFTLWAWRNHPCPIDYWRFSPECLEFLFKGLSTLEKGFDLSQRRNNEMGFWESGMDSVPIDVYGGWRENWASYHIGIKGDSDAFKLKPFKKTDEPYAHYFRMDTQGKITNLKMRLRNFFKCR